MSQPNVLLVVLDSVRAQNIGLYGHHYNTTPFLDAYADRATTYSQARAPGIHSVASHASLWTGAHVAQHQVINHEDHLQSGTTIWETLADHGYRTGIFTTNPVVAHSSNLATFFDHAVTDSLTDNEPTLFPDAHSPTDVAKHEGITGNIQRCLGDDRPLRSFLNGAHHFYLKHKGAALDEILTTDELLTRFHRWRNNTNGPWAACLNLMDAHFPYEPSDEFDRWGGATLRRLHAKLEKPPANEFIQERPWWQLEAFEHLYDGTILELDTHVEQLIKRLQQAGVHDDTLVVVTSDHGEGFGERSRLTGRTRLVDHSWGIDEALTHVPLIVKYPSQKNRHEVREPVSLTAFVPTVRSLLHGDDRINSFVTDVPVVASTRRLRAEEDAIFQGSEHNPEYYYGPWRAVYEQNGGSVYKYSTRHTEARVDEIPDAQTICPIENDSKTPVQETFDSLDSLEIKETHSPAVADDIEDRLGDLGYLR